MTIGHYRGIDWKRQRICDVMALPYRSFAYFTYVDGKPTGDHFRTQHEMFDWITAMDRHGEFLNLDYEDMDIRR